MRAPFATRDRRPQSGATTVEFVFVFPVLCLLLLGMVDASRMMVTRCMLTYAVAVGARAGLAKNNTTVASVQAITAAAAPMLNLSSSSVTVAVNGVAATSASWTARTRGDTVTVSYSGYTFTPVTGSFTKLATKSFNASSIATIP